MTMVRYGIPVHKSATGSWFGHLRAEPRAGFLRARSAPFPYMVMLRQFTV